MHIHLGKNCFYFLVAFRCFRCFRCFRRSRFPCSHPNGSSHHLVGKGSSTPPGGRAKNNGNNGKSSKMNGKLSGGMLQAARSHSFSLATRGVWHGWYYFLFVLLDFPFSPLFSAHVSSREFFQPCARCFRSFCLVFRCFHCFRCFRPVFHPGHSFSPTLQQKTTAVTQAQSTQGILFSPTQESSLGCSG